MANTKSAEKRARQSADQYQRNRWYRSRYRTFIKRARLQIDQGEVDNATESVRKAGQALDAAAQKGVIHKNTAARTKSRLAHAIHKLEASKQA